MEEEFKDIENVSNILNDTKAYIKIGVALDIDIDCNSEIFQEIEEYIVSKFKEMREEMENN